jgi:hypothetical protein
MPCEAQRGIRGTAYPSSTSATDVNGLSTPSPDRLTQGKYPVPIVQEAEWAPVSMCAGVGEKNLLYPPGFEPRTTLSGNVVARLLLKKIL